MTAPTELPPGEGGPPAASGDAGTAAGFERTPSRDSPDFPDQPRWLGPKAAVAWTIVAGVWAVVVLVVYFSHAWPGAEQWLAIPALLRPPTLAAAATALHRLYLAGWLCALMVLAGRPLLRRLRFDTLGEELLLAGGLGAGLIAMVMFILAVVGLWYPTLLAILAVVATVALLPANRDLAGRLQSATRAPRSRERWSWSDRACLAVILLTLVVYLVGALTPEIYYDALVYHLALPRLWLLRHCMVATPSISFSGLPSAMEMLYGLCLSVSDEGVAKLVHFGAGLGTLGVLFMIARRLAGRRAGLLAVLLFLSPPMVMLEFSRSVIDLGSTLFATLALWVVLRGADDQSLDSHELVLAGLLAGFSLATKYTNLAMLVGILLASWVVRCSPARVWSRLRQTALLFVVACAVVLPWLIKNAVFYRNPFYPMLNKLFPAWHVSTLDSSGWQSDAQARQLGWVFGSWHGLRGWLEEPWTVTMKGRMDDDFLGPAFLLSLPVLFLLRRSRRVVALAMAAAVGWFAISLLSALVRFRLPPLGLACVLFGVGWTAEALPAIVRRAGAWLLVAVSLANLAWSGSWQLVTDGWQVVQGRMNKAAYLDRAHVIYPSPYFAAAQFINESAPPGSGCVVLGDARAYYLERPFLAASVFDQHPLLVWANESPDGDALAGRLERQGWRYILLNAAEARRIRSYFVGSLTAHGRAVLDEFWQGHTHLLFREQGRGSTERRDALVFEIVRDRAALEPGVPRVVNAWFAALGELGR